MTYCIIIRGPLGCGKSTISEKLSKILHAEHISVDAILDEYHLITWEEGYISQRSFLKANEIAVERAQIFLDKNTKVLFDGNFYWKSQLEDLMKKLQCTFYIFTLKAPLHVCIERDSRRVPPHGKDAAEAVYNKVNEFDSGIIIDAEQSLDVCIKKILSYLPIETNADD